MAQCTLALAWAWSGPRPTTAALPPPPASPQRRCLGVDRESMAHNLDGRRSAGVPAGPSGSGAVQSRPMTRGLAANVVPAAPGEWLRVVFRVGACRSVSTASPLPPPPPPPPPQVTARAPARAPPGAFRVGLPAEGFEESLCGCSQGASGTYPSSRFRHGWRAIQIIDDLSRDRMRGSAGSCPGAPPVGSARPPEAP